MRKPVLPYEHKGADQPVHPRSLISRPLLTLMTSELSTMKTKIALMQLSPKFGFFFWISLVFLDDL